MSFISFLNVFVVGIVIILTSYDDYRSGIIKNSRIIYGLIAGSIVYIIALVFEYFIGDDRIRSILVGYEHKNIYWYLSIFANAATGFVTGIVLWHFKIWAAGDAKLFTLYCYLIPHDFYQIKGVAFFPGLILLINIFTVVFIFLVIDGIIGIAGKMKSFFKIKKPWKNKNFLAYFHKLREWFVLLLVFTAMFAGMRAMRETLRESISPFLHLSEFTLFVSLFILFKPISSMAKKTVGALIFAGGSIAAILYLFFQGGQNDILKIMQPGGFAICLIFFSRIYRNVGNIKRKIKVKQLRKGMILSPETILMLSEMEEKTKQSALKEENENDYENQPGTECVPKKLGTIWVDGINEEQIRFIRTRLKDDDEIIVANTIPFAPLMALGVISTMISGKLLFHIII